MALTKEAVQSWMRKKGTVMLNVLSEAEYLKLHIAGSANIPWGPDGTAFIQAVKKAYGMMGLFITYSNDPTCAAGPNAAKYLREHKFNADNYPGGIQDWSDSGWPVDGTMAVKKVGAGK